MSGSRTTGRPIVSWQSGVSSTDSRVALCADAACINVVEVLTGASGATPQSNLPRGAYFLSGIGRRDRGDGTFIEGVTKSPTYVFYSTGTAVPSQALLGLVPDFDRDGRSDMGVGNDFTILTTASTAAEIDLFLASGSKKLVRGGWTFNGLVDSAFGAYAILAGDIDGDAFPELLTIEQLRVSGGLTGDATPVTSFAVLRYQLDAKNALVRKQRFELPAGRTFLKLLALGDVDGDGYADTGLLSALPSVPWPTDTNITVGTGVTLDLMFGGPGGLGRVSTLTFRVPNAELGDYDQPVTVRGVGDVDGDGFSDLAVGYSLLNSDTCNKRGPGHIDVLRGSAAADFTDLAEQPDAYYEAIPLGDVNGDGLADFGATHVWVYDLIPIAPRTTCVGSYALGVKPGDLSVYFRDASDALASITWIMPIETDAATCTNGWYSNNQYPVSGTLYGGGDLDGDGFDDFGFVADATHPGGPQACASAGRNVRLFYGASQPSATVGLTLAAPKPPPDDFASQALFLSGEGGVDRLALTAFGHGSGFSAVPSAVNVYAGTRAAMSVQRGYTSSTVDSFGAVLLGGF